MHPSALITNYGSTPLTSATVEFSVNGEVLQTVEWTGNLAFLEKTSVDAGDLSFVLEAENELSVNITSVNGVPDEYLKNNSEMFSFTESSNVNGSVISLFILLNNSPEETTWELKNSLGEVIESGGPYTNAGGVVSLPLSVSELGCYEFIMYDAGGNGLCCGDGPGYYALLGANNEPIFTGQSFGSEDRNQFAYGYVGLDESIKNDSFSIFPNPTTDKASLSMNLSQTVHVSYSINDLAGRSLYQNDLGIIEAGTHNFDNWMIDLPKGVYIVVIKTGNDIATSKLVIE